LVAHVDYPPWYTKFAVFSLSGYRYLGDGDTDRREILHIGTYRYRTGLLPFQGRCPQEIPQIRNFGSKFWPFERNEYLENGRSQRYMSVRA